MNSFISGIAIIAANEGDTDALVRLHEQFLRVHDEAFSLGLSRADRHDFKRLAVLALQASRPVVAH